MEYIWQISFPLFSFPFEMNCRLAASNVWHSFSFSLLGLNPNTNLNFTSSALFVNILAVAAKCFPKAHKTQNPKGKYCLAMKFAFCHLWAAARVQSRGSGWAHLALHSSDLERERWFGSWCGRDEFPKHPVRAQLQPQQCQCHFSPVPLLPTVVICCRGSK